MPELLHSLGLVLGGAMAAGLGALALHIVQAASSPSAEPRPRPLEGQAWLVPGIGLVRIVEVEHAPNVVRFRIDDGGARDDARTYRALLVEFLASGACLAPNDHNEILGVLAEVEAMTSG